MRRAPAILIAWALAAAGCGGSSPPASADDYEDVTEKWTRHGRDHADTHGELVIEQTIDVFATFKSPEWRAAYIAYLTEREDLSPAAVAELTEKSKAEAAAGYEVELLVATYDRRANDLQKGARSTWRVALVDDAGVEIVASEVKRDRRPTSEIKAEFPELGGFHSPYVARFPRTVDLLRPEARKFKLKVTSTQGGVTMVWHE